MACFRSCATRAVSLQAAAPNRLLARPAVVRPRARAQVAVSTPLEARRPPSPTMEEMSAPQRLLNGIPYKVHHTKVPNGIGQALDGKVVKLHFFYPRIGKALPVLFFFCGFLASPPRDSDNPEQPFPGWYQRIVERMVQAGYVVVQYNGPQEIFGLNIPLVGLSEAVAKEAPIFKLLLEETEKQMQQVVDMERVFLAGHSRGAAMAALIVSDPALQSVAGDCGAKVVGIYLLDPVEPPGNPQPSPGKALCETGRAVAIAPADWCGPFNPEELNYLNFYKEGSDSWLDYSPDGDVSHLTFCDGGSFLNAIMDLPALSGVTPVAHLKARETSSESPYTIIRRMLSRIIKQGLGLRQIPQYNTIRKLVDKEGPELVVLRVVFRIDTLLLDRLFQGDILFDGKVQQMRDELRAILAAAPVLSREENDAISVLSEDVLGSLGPAEQVPRWVAQVKRSVGMQADINDQDSPKRVALANRVADDMVRWFKIMQYWRNNNLFD